MGGVNRVFLPLRKGRDPASAGECKVKNARKANKRRDIGWDPDFAIWLVNVTNSRTQLILKDQLLLA